MDLFKEMDRLTEPLSAASKVRTLSREEIEALVAAGAVTPVERIPEFRQRGRVHFPASRKGEYESRYWR